MTEKEEKKETIMNTLKTVLSITKSPASHWVGDGFPVRSLFSPQQKDIDTSPFLLLDYVGPFTFAPTEETAGVGEHPHRGFETVTIVYQGELEHRDSGGNAGHIGPGDVQWMTAASGVLHEEMHSREFSRQGGVMEMVQLWVNLPAKDKMSAPRYQELPKAQIPVVALPENAGQVRIIAGEKDGVQGPAKTFTPINLWDIRLNVGGRAEFVLPAVYTTSLVVLHGTVIVNGSEPVGEAQVVSLGLDGELVTIEAQEDSILLLLNGEPIHEPVVQHGPFVMNTQEEIHQAMRDYRSGKMGSLIEP